MKNLNSVEVSRVAGAGECNDFHYSYYNGNGTKAAVQTIFTSEECGNTLCADEAFKKEFRKDYKNLLNTKEGKAFLEKYRIMRRLDCPPAGEL